MKPTRWKQDLVPVQDLRAGLARWIDHVEKSGRPLVVTQRGRAAVVLLSPAMLDELEEQRQLVAKALRGLAQVKERALAGDGGLWRKAKKRIAEAEPRNGAPTAPRDGDEDD